MFKKFLLNRDGNDMTEYAVIGAVVLLVALAGFQLLGVNILGTIQQVAGAI